MTEDLHRPGEASLPQGRCAGVSVLLNSSCMLFLGVMGVGTTADFSMQDWPAYVTLQIISFCTPKSVSL